MNISDNELIRQATDAMKKAYAPYSGFFVGAALLGENDAGNRAVFTGCNIENAAFSPTMCAERVAVAEAVKNRFKHIVKIAVIGGKGGSVTDFCTPCGVCRQVIGEFADSRTVILLTNGTEIRKYTAAALLPLAFNMDNI